MRKLLTAVFPLSLLLASPAGALNAAPQPNTNTAPKPNIIFILTDDQGWGDVGVFFQNQRKAANDRSEPWFSTPNLDKMAEEGAQLTNHYCPAPVCAPSRASLLLGVTQGHSNVRDNQFDKALEDNHTLASVLKQAGYKTAAIGKWGLQGLPSDKPKWPGHPLNRGFDYYFGAIGHGDGHEHYAKERPYYKKKVQILDGRTEVAEKLDKCYTTDLFTARAKKWIVDHEKTDPGQPFFLYLAFDTPHAVLELPTQAYPAGGGLKGGLQWIGTPGHMINTASGQVDSWMYPDLAKATYDKDNNPSTPEVAWPEAYKRYAMSVRRIDDCVGDLIQLLKDLKIDSNTLVIFTSDNGPSKESYLKKGREYSPAFFNSFGPFDGIKRDCWEGGIREPAIVRWPGHIPARQVLDHPSGFWDWMATFADAAGIPAPARTDGVSQLPSLTGTGKQKDSNIYIEYMENGSTPSYSDFDPSHRGRKRKQMQAIRIGNYQGVRYAIKSPDDDFEIYDIVKDPQQKKNLANTPEGKALQQKMKDRVLQVRRPDESASRPYDDALVSDVQAPKTAAGISWKLYEGAFPWVPELTSLTPVAEGNAKRPNLDAAAGRDKNIAMLFSGYLKIPADGDYTFYVKADTGALLRIHDATVIDADRGYTAGSEREGTIKLKAGMHPFRLYYVHGSQGAPALDFEWSGPGFSKQPIPESVFFYEPAVKMAKTAMIESD